MHVKFISGLFITSLILFFSCKERNESTKEFPALPSIANDTILQDTIKKSIPAEATATIAGADIKINYHSPGVKGRVIWGGLVPYDKVWVTGAHMATAMEIGKDFEAGGKKIPAGKYALFTIPGKEKWTVIINKNWEQHLADKYDEKEDVVRIQVKPEATTHTERLKYSIEETGKSEASIRISWEKVSISFPIKL